jgi:hypothetical protein
VEKFAIDSDFLNKEDIFIFSSFVGSYKDRDYAREIMGYEILQQLVRKAKTYIRSKLDNSFIIASRSLDPERKRWVPIARLLV